MAVNIVLMDGKILSLDEALDGRFLAFELMKDYKEMMNVSDEGQTTYVNWMSDSSDFERFKERHVFYSFEKNSFNRDFYQRLSSRVQLPVLPQGDKDDIFVPNPLYEGDSITKDDCEISMEGVMIRNDDEVILFLDKVDILSYCNSALEKLLLVGDLGPSKTEEDVDILSSLLDVKRKVLEFEAHSSGNYADELERKFNGIARVIRIMKQLDNA